MIRELTYAVKYILGLDKAGSRLKVFPDDVFITSFPKSGNTWTRFLIGNLVCPDGVDFSNIERVVPEPTYLSMRYLNGLPRPRIIKSHSPYDPRYQRVIFVVRDPRDVVVSEYHFAIKQGVIAEDTPVERFLDRFMAGDKEQEGVSWGETVGSWLGAHRSSKRLQDPRNFILVRYEDLLADAQRELATIAAFLGIEASPERLQRAVERSSAGEMRKLEKAQGHLWAVTKETRLDRPFIRAAKSGSWRTELPETCAAEIELAWGHLMSELGYELRLEKELAGGSRTAGARRS